MTRDEAICLMRSGMKCWVVYGDDVLGCNILEYRCDIRSESVRIDIDKYFVDDFGCCNSTMATVGLDFVFENQSEAVVLSERIRLAALEASKQELLDKLDEIDTKIRDRK